VTTQLPTLHTVTDVAAALGVTANYVREKCRLREWPHRRVARGEVRFSDDDYSRVLELCAAPVATSVPQRLSFAPRSRRTA
jgi:hypothetical protein